MFCEKCGTKIEKGAKFCQNCGSVFSTVQAEAQEKIKRPSMPKEPWTIGRIIKTIIVVVFVGGIIFLKFGLGAINSLDSNAVNKNNTAQESYQSGGDANQAIEQLQQASQEAVTNETKIQAKINLAYIYLSEGKDDLALTTFKEAQALLSEGSLQYYLVLGEIALLEKKPNSALIAFNKAYEKDHNDFQINNALNLFYLDLGDEWPQYVSYPKALTYALKAYELQPSDLTKTNLGLAYYFNENYNQTISFLSALDYNKNPYLAYWIGLSYAQKEDIVNAKYYLRIAINSGMDVPQEIINYINSN